MIALVAVLAAIHHAADAHMVAHGVLFDVRADRNDLADDFMARNERSGVGPPIAAGGVQIRMADAAVQDLDGDIMLRSSRRSKS